MDTKNIEWFIEDFYKDLSKVRMDKWNYEDGCILLAAMELFGATGNIRYKDFVIRYLDNYVLADGTIKHYSLKDYNLDNIAPGKALLFAYEQTEDEKYKKAAKHLEEQLKDHPRIKQGNFWHKKIYPNQVWLDGLYMAQPFYMAVETRFGKKEGYKDIIEQFKNVRKFMYNSEKDLYYHGFDASFKAFWADKETGCSKNFWLRAIGWYLMGFTDTMEAMSKAIYEYYFELASIYKEALKGILRYQDEETKLFYQVADRKETNGNYLETSGSAMIAASIFKACRLKVLLAEKYLPVAEEILNGVITQKLKQKDGRLVLLDTCKVAGLGPDMGRRDGSIEYYLSEPIEENDRKGIAALCMAYAGYLMTRE
jgi:unsaturated rhamnogalacturonyl hydrolase